MAVGSIELNEDFNLAKINWPQNLDLKICITINISSLSNPP